VEFLKAHGCGEAQGYYFARPVPATEMRALLERGILPVT
jgi:EAL domain-containing protein (putative c-di-GMP-specific phosphodiesterase class I)